MRRPDTHLRRRRAAAAPAATAEAAALTEVDGHATGMAESIGGPGGLAELATSLRTDLRRL